VTSRRRGLSSWPEATRTVITGDSSPLSVLSLHVEVAGASIDCSCRHQADVSHSYHVLIDRGIPPSQIIVMMYDDIVGPPYPLIRIILQSLLLIRPSPSLAPAQAHNLENPHKGSIVNEVRAAPHSRIPFIAKAPTTKMSETSAAHRATTCLRQCLRQHHHRLFKTARHPRRDAGCALGQRCRFKRCHAQ
jgi:hypothetical protein